MTRRIKHDKFDRSDRLAHHDVDSQDCQCDFHRFLGAINRAVRHGMTSGIHSDKAEILVDRGPLGYAIVVTAGAPDLYTGITFNLEGTLNSIGAYESLAG
jgi:hypothetical protein